jgi:hypothetical protein
MRKTSLVEAIRIRHLVGYYFLRYFKLWLAGVILFSFGLTITVSAVTTISQSYSTSEKLPVGSIVSLQRNSTDQVLASASSNVDSILGVVINADNSLLSLSNGEDNQVQVATSGIMQVLVSDINGTIYRGDHITASPLGGVGMKATGNVRIVGIAQSDLASSSGNQQSSYTDKDGKKHSITLGEVPVLVNVSYYFKEPDKTVVPSALQNIANALAGKTVDTLPIIISAAIFLVTIITVASMIYSMIHSSIISVGRNPMAQSAVYRNLVQLVIVVLVILGVGFASIYMVLTRL